MSTTRSAMQRMVSLARRHPFATLGLVLAVASALGNGILKGSAATSCEVLATANVDRGLVQREIFATGVIKPIEGAQIKTGARLTARIEKMHGKLGDPVTNGQQQRVARALLNSPSVILADEPTGQLDSATSRSIMALFREIRAEGTTIAIVTHDPETASGADRRIVLRDGLVVDNAS